MNFKFFVVWISGMMAYSCSESAKFSEDHSNHFEISIINKDYNHPIADTLIEIIELDSGAPDIFLLHKLYDLPGDLPKSFSSEINRDAIITTVYHPNDTNYRFEQVIGYDTAWRVNQYALYPMISLPLVDIIIMLIIMKRGKWLG